MTDEDDPNFSIHTKSQRLKDQIRAWGNRAAMAQKQGMDDLAKEALDKKRYFENELAKLQEFEVDNT